MIGEFHKCMVGAQPGVVAGIRLLPFSLWQCFNLRAARNPYVCGGALGSRALCEALLWCTVEYGRTAWWQRRAWAVRCMRARLMQRLGMGLDVWISMHAELTAHIGRYSETPRHIDMGDRPSEPVRAPWEMHLVRLLVTETRCTMAEAWDTPVNVARCWADVAAESNGDKSLMSDAEGAAERLALDLDRGVTAA